MQALVLFLFGLLFLFIFWPIGALLLGLAVLLSVSDALGDIARGLVAFVRWQQRLANPPRRDDTPQRDDTEQRSEPPPLDWDR